MLNSPALEYFLEVVRTGSVNEASRRLLVAGSAISRQIGKLEQEIGVPLFERRPRGMVPSEAGALLAAYARRATLETDQVLAEIRGRGRLGATVRVASSQGASQEFLPHAMATFRKENPGTTFQLPVVSPSSATQMVKDGSVDLAVTFSLAPAPDVRVIHAQRAPIQAVVRSDHPLAQRDEIHLHDLLPYPVALTEEGTTNRRLFDLCCSIEGISFEPLLVSSSASALSTFVKEANAVSLNSHITVHERLRNEGLKAIAILNPEMHLRTIQIQAMAGRQLPAVVDAFADHLIRRLAEIEV
ncbi:LysR family transcriptional regulator [Streptomyces sp. 2333.5]|uniref:LysR family transcriptional regulator n=1 Tax=Streptomyces TaxID=1883 RepID=UPI000895C79B|nr:MULTISPECIES: LysR family transcriptional regulator [unclassified Streptomyces]PJJ01714.1 LysR family transcriptional regulator [Streptomyces sp. 2333.5]SEC76648.1 transcriptional regulator, LysR family [Streptomyces sp. 2314.4]SED56093.1 DNA-binding transcriptional regulator, LysR family [Streptomyces sp. 2112.2]SOE13985.1 transcriptional regulator, LysR family [Streptomyces sp. 2323.1]